MFCYVEAWYVYTPGLHITYHNNILNRVLPAIDPNSHVTQQIQKSSLMMAGIQVPKHVGVAE
jgi:hypothetical protein